MRTTILPISLEAKTARQETDALNVSAPFRKTWGSFTHYAFLDATWEDVIGYLSQEGTEGVATTLNMAPWIDEATLQPQLEIAEARILMGLPYTIRFTIRALGLTVTLEETGFLLDDELSEGAQIKGFLKDVTAFKAAQEEMERQRLFYEGTLNRMPIELVVLDKTQHYIFCNKHAIKNEEVRQWLIGKTDLDYCLHRGKDPKTVALRQEYFKKAVDSKSEIEWEEVQKNANGENDYNLKRYSPILGADGEIVIVIGYGFNISDRRRAETRAKQSDELIRSITENVQEGIFRLSVDGQLVFANEAFYSLLPAELAQKLKDKVADEETVSLIRYLAETREDHAGHEVSNVIDGEEQTWLISSRMSDDKAFTDGVVVDITKLKRVQADLEQKNKDLEKAYMELDRFVYSASHDLRAPLTSVLGLVKVMEGEHAQGIDMGQALPYVGMIKSSITRLDSFVKEIIQYYRNNRTEISVQNVDLGDFVQSIYTSLEHLRPEMGLNFEVVNRLEAPLKIDTARLTIILNNLVSNAVKYHHVKGGWIRTELAMDGMDLRITVSDNGPGINPEHHSRLFDMFYRVGFDNSGSGLGLYIVQETVKKLNGQITFDSRPGNGSAFHVSISLES